MSAPTPVDSSGLKRNTTFGITELMQEAKLHPSQPVIDPLLNEGEILGLHGPAEAFKTIFLLQLAESTATGRPFLGMWPVPKPRSVFFFETEMSVQAIGKRLMAMYPSGRSIPQGVRFADEKRLRKFKRAVDLSGKFALLSEWISEANSDLAIIDTCNPFFRGKQSPNDETTVGEFFDRLEGLPCSNRLFSRHNHKPRIDDSDGDGTSRIRGSGQFADVPDLLLELRRTDKRIHKAVLAITKFRHGTKPDDLILWFDSGELRLTAVPPVVHLLRCGPLSRRDLLNRLAFRFGISQRLADEMISEQRPFLQEYQKGHERVFQLDTQTAEREPWFLAIDNLE